MLQLKILCAATKANTKVQATTYIIKINIKIYINLETKTTTPSGLLDPIIDVSFPSLALQLLWFPF